MATKPECPYCGKTTGLRQVHEGCGSIPAEYTCEGCFTATDTGPCFDDLPLAPVTMTPREAGEAAFYECEGNNAAALKAAFDAYEAADQSHKVAEVAREYWWPDRLPQDFGERQLAAALIRAFGSFAREVCGCEDSDECDECPSQSEIDAFLAKADADLNKSKEAISNWSEMLSIISQAKEA